MREAWRRILSVIPTMGGGLRTDQIAQLSGAATTTVLPYLSMFRRRELVTRQKADDGRWRYTRSVSLATVRKAKSLPEFLTEGL